MWCLQLSRTIPNVECNIASQPVFAIPDTGSDIDLISHEYVLRRRLTLKRPSPGAQRVELANGKTVKITGRVKLKLKCDMLLPNIGHRLMKPHRVTFHVMPELTQDVLFGYDSFERLKMCLKKCNEPLDLGTLGFGGVLDRSDVGISQDDSSVSGSPTTLDLNGQDPPRAPNMPPLIDLHVPPHEHELMKSQISLITSHQPSRSPEGRNEGHYPPRLEPGQYRTHISSPGSSAGVTREALNRKARAAWPNVLERFGKSVMQQARAREGVGGSTFHSVGRSLYVGCYG
jgi:hypothetical protein